MVDLPEIFFPLKDYLPHNGVLWIWMRTGHLGFFCFIMMIVAILINGIQILKRTDDMLLRMVGTLAIVYLLMLFVYRKYDLQFTNPRSMTIAAVLVGILAVMDKIKAPPAEEKGFVVSSQAMPSTTILITDNV